MFNYPWWARVPGLAFGTLIIHKRHWLFMNYHARNLYETTVPPSVRFSDQLVFLGDLVDPGSNTPILCSRRGWTAKPGSCRVTNSMPTWCAAEFRNSHHAFPSRPVLFYHPSLSFLQSLRLTLRRSPRLSLWLPLLLFLHLSLLPSPFSPVSSQ